MPRKFLSRLLSQRDPQPMWKNFLQSMGLLAVAMIAALYSTGAARSGNIISAAAAALVSLAIAAWVGIRFVPRLAQGVDWAWLPIFTRYKITRDGGIFAAAFVVVVSAAINTSNNLLYMVLSALLAVVVLSGILSEMNFRFLEMELRLPARAFAGERFPLSLKIHNAKRFFPAFSLQAEAPGGTLYFSAVRPQAAAVHSGETAFDSRGRHTINKLTTASRFPFGFFSKSRDYSIQAECLCYPEILPQEQLDFSVADLLGASPRQERGTGNDLHTIRDYVTSDESRHVHWKASAKTGALKTREFAAEDSRRIVLAFDRFGSSRDTAHFEELVKRAASAAFHLSRAGADVLFVSDEWESSSATSESTLDAILGYLALVRMAPEADAPDADPQQGALLFSLRRGGDFA